MSAATGPQPPRTEPSDITAAAVASFSGCHDERLRLLLERLTAHLHAFAAEVGLTQNEWEAGIRLLTETGRITDAHRQEFVLWSDTLGLSMLVDALASPTPDATESTVFGPFRESAYLDSDAVFAVKPSLLRDFVPRGADDPARPEGVDGPWFSVRNDLVLAPIDD